MAPLYAGHGGGIDGPCLERARNAALSRATVASASGGVSTQGVGNSTMRWPEQATCVHTTGVEGVTRDERATGKPWGGASRSVCSCDSRQAGLWYLPARWRYMTMHQGAPALSAHRSNHRAAVRLP